MKRLTARNKDGSAYYVGCFSENAPCGGGYPGEACARCDFQSLQCEKLAAYEDSCLEPDDLTEHFSSETAIKMAACALGTTPERLQEMVRASTEGRLKIISIKSADRCCGTCENFVRESGTAHGRCKIRQVQKDRYGRDYKNTVFMPPQSRNACQAYVRRGE